MIWLSYLIGAGLALGYKYVRYLVGAAPRGKSWRTATIEWFFEPSAENGVSWITTIGVVWVLGYLYVSGALGYFDFMPRHASIAFLLGTIAEMIAPTAAKWFIAKVTKPFSTSG